MSGTTTIVSNKRVYQKSDTPSVFNAVVFDERQAVLGQANSRRSWRVMMISPVA